MVAFVRALAAAIALTVLVAPKADASVFRCAYTDLVMSACCCPSAEQPVEPTLSRGSCCKVEHVSSALPSANVDAIKLRLGLQRWVAAPVDLAPPPLASVVASVPTHASTFRYSAPPRAGPSLTIVYRRLLI